MIAVLSDSQMKSGREHDSVESLPPLVDESLISAMLELSPEERLRQNDRMVRTILLLRQGLAGKTEPDAREPQSSFRLAGARRGEH
jgi:hypothetical protein